MRSNDANVVGTESSLEAPLAFSSTHSLGAGFSEWVSPFFPLGTETSLSKLFRHFYIQVNAKTMGQLSLDKNNQNYSRRRLHSFLVSLLVWRLVLYKQGKLFFRDLAQSTQEKLSTKITDGNDRIVTSI